MTERFLAVDVGGSRVKWALASEAGVDAPRAEETALPLDRLLDQLARIYDEAASGRPLLWGLCMPGLIDANRGVLMYSANLAARDVPVLRLLAERVERPRVLVNDLAAAAAGEAGTDGLALLQVGTGVAARLVVDGRVVNGANGYAGEIGHLVFRENGLPCECGRAGCVEAYGGWGPIRRRHEQAGRSEPTPRSLLDEARTDPWAAAVLADALEAIGFAASALVAACDPGLVRLGGGLSAAWNGELVAAIEAAFATRLLPELGASTRVEVSTLRERATLLGLYRLARGEARA